jgi:SAM-dependent methyltransferase
VAKKVGAKYDNMSPMYNELQAKTNLQGLVYNILRLYNFDGDILDLACGSGLFGRLLRVHEKKRTIHLHSPTQKPTHVLVGVDLSPLMAGQMRKRTELRQSHHRSDATHNPIHAAHRPHRLNFLSPLPISAGPQSCP